MIVEAARHGADWVICADADERYETRFLRSLEAVARANEQRGREVLFVRIVNLWDGADQSRVDGRCAPRWTARMFRMPDMISRRAPMMHQPWFPPELDQAKRGFVPAILYHLKMIRREDRETRHAKFTTIDPNNIHQPFGYGHMIDETGLTLQKVLSFRGYEDLPSCAPAAAGEEPLPASDDRGGEGFAAGFHGVVETPAVSPAVRPLRRPIHGFDFETIFSATRSGRG